MSINVWGLFRIEWRKLRRSGITAVYFLATLILWIPSVLNADLNFTMQDVGILPEDNFLIQGYMGYAWFLFPACLVVSTVLLTQMERGNGGLRRMLSLPVSPVRLCMAKFLVLLALTAELTLMSFAAWAAGAAAAGRIYGYDFMRPLSDTFGFVCRIWLAGIPMAACFWLLAAAVRTPVFAVGIGLISIIPSVLLINTRICVFYPAAYPFYVVANEYTKLAEHFSVSPIRMGQWLPPAAAITCTALAAACGLFGREERR